MTKRPGGAGHFVHHAFQNGIRLLEFDAVHIPFKPARHLVRLAGEQRHDDARDADDGEAFVAEDVEDERCAERDERHVREEDEWPEADITEAGIDAPAEIPKRHRDRQHRAEKADGAVAFPGADAEGDERERPGVFSPLRKRLEQHFVPVAAELDGVRALRHERKHPEGRAEHADDAGGQDKLRAVPPVAAVEKHGGADDHDRDQRREKMRVEAERQQQRGARADFLIFDVTVSRAEKKARTGRTTRSWRSCRRACF
ncbi:MAG: hypothetical protein M5R36_10335 [Deltaproteobacteria bacterium]|nr:hypothetical protein [Deltaproteobacteria bacterium]